MHMTGHGKIPPIDESVGDNWLTCACFGDMVDNHGMFFMTIYFILEHSVGREDAGFMCNGCFSPHFPTKLLLYTSNYS